MCALSLNYLSSEGLRESKFLLYNDVDSFNQIMLTWRTDLSVLSKILKAIHQTLRA